MAAAVAASTMCCMEGRSLVSGAVLSAQGAATRGCGRRERVQYLNIRGEWGRVPIVGRVINTRSYLPSGRAMASLVSWLAVIAIQCLGEDGPFGVATTARRFIAAAGSCGRRCVATGRSCLSRPAGGGSLVEDLSDPFGADVGGVHPVQEVAQARDVVD